MILIGNLESSGAILWFPAMSNILNFLYFPNIFAQVERFTAQIHAKIKSRQTF